MIASLKTRLQPYTNRMRPFILGQQRLVGGGAAVTTGALVSSVEGLGTLNYISGPVATFSNLITNDLTVNSNLYSLSNLTANTAFISTIQFYNTAPRQDGGMYINNDPYTLFVSGSKLQYGPNNLFPPGSLPTSRYDIVTDSNLGSTVKGLGQIYLSTAGGGGGDVTSANLASTV